MSYLYVQYESNKGHKGHIVVKCNLSEISYLRATLLRLGAMGMMPGGNRRLVKSGDSYKKGVQRSCGGGGEQRQKITTVAGMLAANLTGRQAQERVVALNLLQTQKDALTSLKELADKTDSSLASRKLQGSLDDIDHEISEANGDDWMAKAKKVRSIIMAIATSATKDFFNLVDSTISGAIAADFDSDQPGRALRTAFKWTGMSGFSATDKLRNMAEATFKQGESFLMDPEESVNDYIDRIEKATNLGKESGLQTASRYVNTFFGQETATQALRNMTDKPNAFHDFCRWRRRILGKETLMDKAKKSMKSNEKNVLCKTLHDDVQIRWDEVEAAKKQANTIGQVTDGVVAAGTVLSGGVVAAGTALSAAVNAAGQAASSGIDYLTGRRGHQQIRGSSNIRERAREADIDSYASAQESQDMETAIRDMPIFMKNWLKKEKNQYKTIAAEKRKPENKKLKQALDTFSSYCKTLPTKPNPFTAASNVQKAERDQRRKKISSSNRSHH